MKRTPALILSALAAVSALAAPCPLVHKAAPGDTLSSLAEFYFGDPDFAPAILIATNSRLDEEQFSFISNPDALDGAICIPGADEALRSRDRYAVYQRSVSAMSVVHPWETTTDLVRIPYGQSVTVATWTREGPAARYQVNVPQKALQDTWVTVEPHLRDFCRAFAKTHSSNDELLTTRLEQRLGLPPASGDTVFMRIRLANPSPQTIFRPCSDPATNEAHCEAAPPDEKKVPSYAAWFYRQYYSAYGLPRPNLFPWTALGYTFDWAQNPDGSFVRKGETEFVIPAGAPIEVLGSMTTADYCR